MFHDDFRPRKRLLLVKTEESRKGVSFLPYHEMVASAIDAAIAAAPEDPTHVREIGDQCAELLLNAMTRFDQTQIEDPFGIYDQLLPLPRSVLQDIYNHLLTDDELPMGSVAGPLIPLGPH